MINALFFMLLTGICWAGVGILFGAAPSEKDRLYTFFALNGAIFTAFVYCVQPPPAAPVAEVLRLSAMMVPSALMEVVAFLFLKHAMERGRQGIAWSVAQSALVIPFLCSVVFLHNPSFAAQWTGLALVIGGLLLLGMDKPEKRDVRSDATYFRLVAASFALIGAGQFLRLLPGSAGFSPEVLAWRLPLQAPVGLVFWLSACLMKRLWSPRAVLRHALPYGIVVALGQLFFYKAADAADILRLTSVVVPVSIGTCIMLFNLYCCFCKGERLSPRGWLAVAMDICGIALLSCGSPGA